MMKKKKKMRAALIILIGSVFANLTYSQEWRIVDIVSQNSKELVVYIDTGEEKIKREKRESPSIVKLIMDYQAEGFQLEKVTQGVELDLNGNFPLNTNRMNNIGFTNLTLSNNNRIFLWFKKPKD